MFGNSKMLSTFEEVAAKLIYLRPSKVFNLTHMQWILETPRVSDSLYHSL